MLKLTYAYTHKQAFGSYHSTKKWSKTTKITKAFQLRITANQMIARLREFIKKINMASNGEDMQGDMQMKQLVCKI